MKLSKNMTNEEIADLLRAVAAAYEIKYEKIPNNRFRVIAYERAADSVEHATSELHSLWKEGKLDSVPGLGKSIQEHLSQIFERGISKHFDSVLKSLPPAMFELLKVPGIGTKTAYKLTKELGIKNPKRALDRLISDARKGKIKKIEGFGQQSEKEIIEAALGLKGKTKRFLLPYAATIGNELIEWLAKDKNVKKADVLGSLRRQAATVGDIDISVASEKPEEMIKHFLAYPKKSRNIESGEHTASIMLPGSFQIDLMVQPEDAYGALLQHFTGSKNHNVALRTYAQKKGLSLSEYGIKIKGRLYKFANEKDFYKELGMDWIAPELREDRGEIQAALEKKLPKLIESRQIKGDLHLHSNFLTETSHDTGANSIEEHVRKAGELGYQYLAFTEHNPKTSLSKNKIIDEIKRKKEYIDKLNYSREKKSEKGVRKIFNSLEIDIKPDGSLALPDEAFDKLDFAIVAIHSSFKGSKDSQTKRVLQALSHPKVLIFAHPTARKLQEREGIDLDWNLVFAYCKKHNKILEINAWPDRLDLPDTLVHEAVKIGVKLSISTDSHALDQMDLMRFGVSVARRGWAEKDDIVNTLGYTNFEKLIKKAVRI